MCAGCALLALDDRAGSGSLFPERILNGRSAGHSPWSLAEGPRHGISGRRVHASHVGEIVIQAHTLCVELTSKCPLRCIHCSASAAPERLEMLGAEMFEQRVLGLDHLEEIYLSGGEPFEHPTLARIVRSARRAAGAVVIYSSGVQIRPDGNEPLALEALRAVTAAGASRLDVSLYAASAEEHDAVTLTPDSFELTLETLRRLAAEGTPFGVHLVLQHSTRDVVRVATIARELGAIRLHVLALAPQGRGRALGPVTLPAGLIEELHHLRLQPNGIEIVLSSGVRRALGLCEPTARDMHRALMLDVNGFLYPGEGRRLPLLRSESSIAVRGLRELVAEMSFV